MKNDPVLRSGFFHKLEVQARGGLHMIKGNDKPYFSLTMASWAHMPSGRRVEDMFGAAHEDLVRYWPELAPLAALHRSDIDGVPMHALENGWYWLVGAATVKAFKEAVPCHGGNGPGAKSPDECLAILAKHLRIDADQAHKLVRSVERHVLGLERGRGGVAAGKARLAAFVDAQKLRWRREAQDCIKALDLKVFGDPYDSNVKEAA